MTQYRLTAPHYLRSGKEGEAGTEVYVPVGDLVEWPGPPTLGMEGVDDEGKAKCKERDEKRRAQTAEAVAAGRLSRIQAENLGPKPTPTEDEAEDDEPHRGRRPKR
jgi:hypothetical protein